MVWDPIRSSFFIPNEAGLPFLLIYIFINIITRKNMCLARPISNPNPKIGTFSFWDSMHCIKACPFTKTASINSLQLLVFPISNASPWCFIPITTTWTPLNSKTAWNNCALLETKNYSALRLPIISLCISWSQASIKATSLSFCESLSILFSAWLEDFTQKIKYGPEGSWGTLWYA